MFAERYLKAELHFLIHFRIGGVDEECVAYLQRELSVSRFEMGVDRFHLGDNRTHRVQMSEGVGECGGGVSTQVHTEDGCPYGRYKAVFVDVVKLVEMPERVIPTLVWFGRVDRIYSILPHSLYFSRTFGSVFRGVIRNREADVARWTALRNPRPTPEKLIGQVIEGTSEILQNVASDSSDSLRDLLDANHTIDQLSRLRIALSSDEVWVGSKKGSEFNLQIADVLFGPLNFDPDEAYRIHEAEA